MDAFAFLDFKLNFYKIYFSYINIFLKSTLPYLIITSIRI